MENAVQAVEVKRGRGRPKLAEPSVKIFVSLPPSLYGRIAAAANSGATVQNVVRKVLTEKFVPVS